MPNIKIHQKTLKLARECLPLFQDVRRSAIIHGVSDRPTDSTALAFALDRRDQFVCSGGTILWPVLMALPKERFDIPSSFDCDIRYSTTLTGSSLFSRIDGLVDALNALPAFSSDSRGVYKNYAVRAALRLSYALDHEKDFRDVLIVAGTDSKDAPAAFDPYRLMFLYRPDSRNSEGIDPSIFDQSDLFPNGKVDAEGFADDSELF